VEAGAGRIIEVSGGQLGDSVTPTTSTLAVMRGATVRAVPVPEFGVHDPGPNSGYCPHAPRSLGWRASGERSDGA
jgi:hypothetical protein